MRSRPSRGQLSALPAQTTRSVFDADRGRAVQAQDTPRGAALRITVLNGNLSFIRQPLLLGHYRAATLTGTEAVVDRLVGGSMQAALDAGLYPDTVGTHQIFVNTWRSPDNPWRAPRPQCAIVVGLGDEGVLTETRLRDSVRQAVIAWAQRVVEEPAQAGAEIEIAATLLGSGGMGIAPSGTARAIAQGVREANDRLAGSGWPLVGRLTLVELYLDRASEAWRGLQVLATASPDRFELAPTIASGTGPLRRQADSGYRGADHDFITATAGELPDSIAFTLDTRRARTEMRAQMHAGQAAARPGGARVHRRQQRPTDRPHACSSCWCRSRSSPSWAARSACCWNWTTAPRRFPGSCWKRPTTTAAVPTLDPGPSAASCCASCARRTIEVRRATPAPRTPCSSSASRRSIAPGTARCPAHWPRPGRWWRSSAGPAVWRPIA